MSSSSRPSLTAIVAATASNGIGVNNGLPWRLPQEMQYFARVTAGVNPDPDNVNAVIMGRKTWEGIPAKFRPLKGRQNLVVSRNEDYDLADAPNSTMHPSLSAAAASLSPNTRAFLIGGSQLYNLALTSSPPLVDRVLFTRVLEPAFPECDVFLHDFCEDVDEAGKKRWRREGKKEMEEWIGGEIGEEERLERGVRYRFEMWVLNEE